MLLILRFSNLPIILESDKKMFLKIFCRFPAFCGKIIANLRHNYSISDFGMWISE
jgi:hypothetical protein